ncbi:MAG: cupin domain-containing protein [Clostridia bacterium]|nr:cupin domain-containing protein [Clostridia bacterium]
MVIDFDKIEMKNVEHLQGGEKYVGVQAFDQPEMRVVKVTLIPGASLGLHTHTINSEVVYCLSGTGKTICDGEEQRLQPGSCSYCPKGHQHTLINDGEENLVCLGVIPVQ